MDENLYVHVFRGVERILVVIGGITAVYLGYRLFRLVDIKQESSAGLKTKLMEASASKIGPGIFFALFGTAVLWSSLTNPIIFDENGNVQQQRPAAPPLQLTQAELAQLRQMIATGKNEREIELLRKIVRTVEP